MPEPTVLATIAAIAKVGGDIASTKDEAERNKLLLEFQKSVIAANFQLATLQQEISALKQTNDELKREAARKEDWASESQRYVLHDVSDGLVVYALKQSMSNGEPPHYLCANCFNDSKKTILFAGHLPGSNRVETLICKTCNTYAPTGYSGGTRPKFPDSQ